MLTWLLNALHTRLHLLELHGPARWTGLCRPLMMDKVLRAIDMPAVRYCNPGVDLDKDIVNPTSKLDVN